MPNTQGGGPSIRHGMSASSIMKERRRLGTSHSNAQTKKNLNPLNSLHNIVSVSRSTTKVIIKLLAEQNKKITFKKCIEQFENHCQDLLLLLLKVMQLI